MTEGDFREAYRLNKDVVYRFARRMTGEAATAEDVVQESFLSLWKNDAVYRADRGSLRSFLIGVARNLVLQHLRRDRPCDELEEETAVSNPVDIVEIERAELIARAVAALPLLQREALIMAEYEGMSLEEIGQATNVGIAAVKSRLFRARENLRSMLTPLLERKDKVHGTK